jgi:hypothetical protein
MCAGDGALNRVAGTAHKMKSASHLAAHIACRLAAKGFNAKA